MFRMLSGPAAVAVAGIGLLSIMDGLIKYVAAHHGTAQIVLLRYIFGGLVAIAVFRAMRTPWPRWEVIRPHAWRSVLVACTAFMFFYALAVLPLAVVLALSFTSPIFIALFAGLILGERPGGAVLVALLLGVCGVIVVLWDELARSGTGQNGLGIAAAIGSAVTYALSMVTLKSRASIDPIPTIVLLQNVLAGLLMAPFGVAVWTVPSMIDIGIFLCIGLLGTAGHICLAWAYGRAEASRLGVMEYTSFVWAVVIGLLAFGEIPALATLIGAALIVCGALIASRKPTQIHEPEIEVGP